jgi:phosphohistidine swiveling domain-containing protein
MSVIGLSTILPLDATEATLPVVGGKGANLVRLRRAGLPVPAGFLLPVSAYRAFVAQNGLDKVIDAALHGLDAADPPALMGAAANIRAAFATGVMAPALRASLAEGYRNLGEPPVAVRSSATAEDLPDLSFAGQQDTFLNVRGVEALYRAVVQCWSSLWTGRAIAYRARNGIEQADVALAVVVQVMVPAQAAGVLFTANPLTGRRTEMAIDATLGLGEALVSGEVEPDHYVVDPARGVILHKTLGAKDAVIAAQEGGGTVTRRADNRAIQAVPDAVILQLAALGSRVQALYGCPQDIEWGWDGASLHLLQARPITSLYPLPEGMPLEPLQAMFAFMAVQGVFEPFTPLGQDTIKLLLGAVRRSFGYAPDFDRQTTIVSAAERLYINCTPVLSNRIGREVLPEMMRALDPGMAQAFAAIIEDPRLAPTGPVLQPDTLRRILGFALPLLRRIVCNWRNPDGARRQFTQQIDAVLAQSAARSAAVGDLWPDYERRLDLLLSITDLFPGLILPQGLPLVVAGMIPFFGILQGFAEAAAAASGQPALAQLPLTIARSLPHNVTTEMDLALWQAAQIVRGDAHSMQVFRDSSAAELAQDYLAGRLPPVAQMAVAIFMHQYGMRGPGEIDIGRPRWREQPEPLMQVLQSYLAIDDPAVAPDVLFAGGVAHAMAAAQQLEAAVAALPGRAIKARLVRWAITRYRALAGMREAPKFFAVRMLGLVRQGLLASGGALAEAGLLQQADDLCFLTVRELQEIGAQRAVSPALRATIAGRRGVHEREMRRKQLPRVLLSDGTAYYAGVRSPVTDDAGAETLAGDPVSPGVVEGVVRVVFSPNDVQLAPGEILVCPGTDPAWTPLFLAAGGLVTEVGGMMTHGSVVAREYGIPAVVGVHEATSRLRSGQRVLR